MKHLLRIIIVILGCFHSSPASAEDANTEAAVAEFNLGVRYFKARKLEQAVSCFRKANRLAPSWKLQYNIGQCEAMLKRYGLAIEAFEHYLAHGGDEVPVERRDSILKELDRLRKMVGGIVVKGEDDVEVHVDNILRGITPIKSPISVTSGIDHWICFVRREIKLSCVKTRVHGGKRLTVKIPDAAPAGASGAVTPVTPPPTAPTPVKTTPPAALAPTTEPPPPAAPEETAAPREPGEHPQTVHSNAGSPGPAHADLDGHDRARLSPVVFSVGAGCTALFGGITLGLAVAVESKWGKIEKNPSNYDRADLDALRNMQVAGYAFMGLAFAGLLTAVIAAPLTRWKRNRDISKAPNVSLSPWGASGAAGVTATGSFWP